MIERIETASHERRLIVLDGLRGIAILAVVWYHTWEISWLYADVHLGPYVVNFNILPESGFLGVELFFFISGFCLFYPYARTLFDGKPQQTLGQYAWRRAIKILPSYVLSIALMLVLGIAAVDQFTNLPRQILLHLAFIHPWFDDSFASINGVLWSLGVEVEFYVIFPLLVWMALRKPTWVFAGMFLVAMVYRYAIPPHPYGIQHLVNQLPAVLDLFAAGMACAYGYRLIAVRYPRLAAQRWLWTGVAFASIYGCYLLVNGLFSTRYTIPDFASVWQVSWRPLFSIDLLLITLGSLFAFPIWQEILGNRVLVFFSLISYNLYLWHQIIDVWLNKHHIPQWTTSDMHADHQWSLNYTLIAFACTTLVATFFTFAFERPLLRWRPFERLRETQRTESFSSETAGSSP